MNPCPVCDNKNNLAAMDMSPELIAEIVAQESVADYVGDEIYAERLKICNNCEKLVGGMTCQNCGCFVQFRARHLAAACVEGRWLR